MRLAILPELFLIQIGMELDLIGKGGIHIVIQNLATGFVGIFIFAAGCIELVLAQALLRQRLRLLQI